MASYNIQWKKSAYKELRKIHTSELPTIIESVEKLSITPFPSGVKKISGSEKTYRIKIGDYRIIYEIMKQELIILIIRVRHRKDVYNK